TLRSAVVHITTAVIGASVLSLAWSTSQLGWIADPVSLLLFATVTYISSFLLSDCYKTSDPVSTEQCHHHNHSSKRTWLAGFLQYLTLYGTCIAYVITITSFISVIINRSGFNSQGIVAVAKCLGAQHGKRKLDDTSSSSHTSNNDVKHGGKVGPGILCVNLERTRQVKMLQQYMFNGFIHCPSMLITW
ncbi:hypothetical protein HN873_063424, partial [Arachis hypogaea]